MGSPGRAVGRSRLSWPPCRGTAQACPHRRQWLPCPAGLCSLPAGGPLPPTQQPASTPASSGPCYTSTHRPLFLDRRTMANLVSTHARFIPPPMRPGPSRPILGRNEHVVSWELLEQGLRLAKVCGQHVGRVPGDPLRQVDRLVDAVVEPDQDAARLVADVLERVSVSLGCSRRRPFPASRSGTDRRSRTSLC